MAEQRADRLTELEERYAGYKVYDRNGEKIGKVDYLFVDENDQPEYLGVKVGLLGIKSTLIPMDVVGVHEDRQVIEVSETKDKIEAGPDFDNDEEITPEYEEQVRSHYGLGSLKASAEQGTYGKYYSGDSDGGGRLRAAQGSYPAKQRQDRENSSEVGGPGARMGDTETGEYRGHAREQEGLRQRRSSGLRSSGLREGEDELRVQRSEEELVAGTREREIGGVRVRKRVRTDREQLRVTKRREEVHVERVAVDREAPEAKIGENEFFVPVIEEEVVVEKRPVAKEEIHLRKEVVEEEEVIEGDVHKEEVDIDDQTERQTVLEHGLDTGNERRRRSA